jgi:hypothetical protein
MAWISVTAYVGDDGAVTFKDGETVKDRLLDVPTAKQQKAIAARNWERLHETKPDQWFATHAEACESWLDALAEGRLDEAAVMCDYLEERGLKQGETIRKMIRPNMVRYRFRKHMRDNMRHGVNPYASASVLTETRINLGWKVLRRFFRYYLNGRASDAVNAFTRKKMQENGTLRQIMPPAPVDFAGEIGDAPAIVRDA